MEKSVLITGGNRGIGLEFIKTYAKLNWQLVVALKNPDSPSIQSLKNEYKNIETIQLDVTNFSDYSKLENYFKNRSLDLLINNAGISGKSDQTIGQVDHHNLQHVFATNTFAPMLVAQAVFEALSKGKGKVIANITSKMGSIADNTSGRSYAYRSSKAALNAMMRSLQIDIQDKGFKVLLLHPGWVKTDMGGEDALTDTSTSVKGMLKLIEQAHELPDQFYDFQGQVVPW